MKKIVYLLPMAGFAALAMSTASAHADPINILSSYVGQTISITAEPYASGENNGPFYVGLTQLNLATLGGTAIGSIEAFCDDFAHDITLPDTYNAVVTAITGTTLEQEAYYGMEFGSTPSGNLILDSELQELIWNYTAAPSQRFALNWDMIALRRNMLANYQGVNYSNSFYLNAGDSGQSFMSTDPSPVPEPPTLVMLATGLCAIAFFARRRLLSGGTYAVANR